MRPSSAPYGRDVTVRDLQLYRDSSFVETVPPKGRELVTAWLLFPELDPPVKWEATITDRAEWDVPATGDEGTNAIPAGTRVEGWVNGEAMTYGEVIRSGDIEP